MATTKKQKKAVEAKTPVKKVDTANAVKDQKKPETKTPVIEPKPAQENKAVDKVKKPKVVKPEMVSIFSTTYGYWRYFVKTILADGGISKFRFVKDEGSYNGKIAVPAGEVEKAKKVLADYRAKHPEEKEMWQ